MVTTASELETHLRGKAPQTIGALVYWRNLADAKIARGILKQGFDDAGVGPAVPSPKTEKMLTDAVTRAKAGRGQEVKIDLKAKNQKSIYRVLMRRDEAGRARYLEEATIAIDRYAANAQLETSLLPNVPADDVRDNLIEDVRDFLAEIRAYAFPNEVSDALVSAMEMVHALPLRTGVYFVPAAGVDVAKKLAAFLSRETPATLTIWEIGDTPANALTARQDARSGFLDRLDELKARIAKFTAATTVEAATGRAVSVRVGYFKQLDAEVEMWTDILGSVVDELRASIADAKTQLLGPYLGLLDDQVADQTSEEDASQDAA
jgi:hypothetical protein